MSTRRAQPGRRRSVGGVVGTRSVARIAELPVDARRQADAVRPVPFLEGNWVEPQARRIGVGRALIQAVVADLLDRGFRELCSDAGIRNRKSHLAHQAWGFAETERVVYFRRPL